MWRDGACRQRDFDELHRRRATADSSWTSSTTSTRSRRSCACSASHTSAATPARVLGSSASASGPAAPRRRAAISVGIGGTRSRSASTIPRAKTRERRVLGRGAVPGAVHARGPRRQQRRLPEPGVGDDDRQSPLERFVKTREQTVAAEQRRGAAGGRNFVIAVALGGAAGAVHALTSRRAWSCGTSQDHGASARRRLRRRAAQRGRCIPSRRGSERRSASPGPGSARRPRPRPGARARAG